MIDIHTHILPGIDDGAADMYDALQMAHIAADNGVTALVATPHCNIPGLYDNYYGEELIEVFLQTESMFAKEGIPLTLYAGMEVFVTSKVPDLLREGKLLTINGGHYILVEFSFGEDPRFVNRMLEEIQSLGLHPIIAHPERYEFVKDNIHMAYDWRCKGYEIQVNKGSLQGRFGSDSFQVAHALMNHNLVTAIASDAHSPYQRTPNLADAYAELTRMYPTDYLKVIFEENPLRICRDQQLIQFKKHPFVEEEW